MERERERDSLFLMLALRVEYIFLTTFYGLYFNDQLHYTISSSSYMFHGNLLWAAFMYCMYKALQPDPIKGSHTLPMLGSWSSATRIIAIYYSLSAIPCPDLNSGPPRPQSEHNKWRSRLLGYEGSFMNSQVCVFENVFKGFKEMFLLFVLHFHF